VDAAIIFADLLLPLEVMGLPFHFSRGEGPVIEKPVRAEEDITRLRTDRAADLDTCPKRCAWCASIWNAPARDRLLRRTIHPRQLHDRGGAPAITFTPKK